MPGRGGIAGAGSSVKVGCPHYWIIESPAGPTSEAICVLCGAAAEFSNYVPLTSPGFLCEFEIEDGRDSQLAPVG
jgi:hypothetical protein